jgi:glycogen debranching enzyme
LSDKEIIMPNFFSSCRSTRIVFVAVLFAASQAIAQNLFPVGPIALNAAGPSIRAHSEAQKPFTVSGERGVVLGQQDGTFEAWILPVKVLSDVTIQADVEGYTVPIDVNKQAAQIEVRPDRTVITYAHIGFTVRQIMFSPADTLTGTGPIVLFEFDCVHPTDFTLRFTPELRWMWPERNEGVPSVEWVAPPPNAAMKAGGFYVLHSDYPDLAAAVTIPGARPGILAPYQERPQVHSVEMKLHIDPVRDHGRLFPLLMAVGTNQASANPASLGATLERLNAGIATSYRSHAERFKKLLATSVSIETPDKALNEAFQWAEISIEQLRTRVRTQRQEADSGQRDVNETGLVAGYFASGDSTRPGFGWFFGRDALYTLYAVNSYGDFALSKSELEFLMRRQRDDGKIMHEYSQTAGDIDWKAFPYMYAAADATPLFLLGMLDYVRASGDVAFLTTHRDVVEKAWTFETSHAPPVDKGGNGIYNNTQGTGWVESWPGGMPHQEVYLALLDQQASGAMAKMEEILGDKQKAEEARQRAEAVQKTIESQFYDPDKSCYAFSRNPDGSLDRTSTVYPALAWWSNNSVTGNSTFLAHPGDCLKQLAAHTLNTDWGLRDVSSEEKIYDGMSYHQGSVWPLFTGWAALAEYRGEQPLAGYQMLMENANLTREQDLGAVTELLSGDVFIPFGRSTSHQLWSSAMVITPTLRGLFGIDLDAQSKTITVNPHLPANWDHAEIKHLRLGSDTADLVFTQTAGEVTVSIQGGTGVKVVSTLSGIKHAPNGTLGIPRHPVEVGSFFNPPDPGDRMKSMRVLNATYGERRLTLTLEGLAGSIAELPLVLAKPDLNLAAVGVELPTLSHATASPALHELPMMKVRFPDGDGWKTTTVMLSW